jgi:hypothetical protein
MPMCPICTVAVGVGLGLSRWLKIADTISGLWIGAFIVSLSSVSATFTRKYISASHALLMMGYIIFYFVLTIFPLQYMGIIGHPIHRIFGVDKLVFGVVFGVVVFFLSNGLHLWLKKRNNNKSYFPFQKVVIPLWTLLIVSIIFSVLSVT